MQYSLYWITTLAFAAILLIILISDCLTIKSPNKTEKSFRIMLIWVISFCLQDSFWGLCANHIINNDTVFFYSSECFHIAAVTTTFFWLNYILTYLGNKIHHKKLFLSIDFLIIFSEIVIVIINIFTPILFTIENRQYITHRLRPVTFLNQYVVYIIIAVATFICALKEKTSSKNKFFTVFVYSLAPVILGIFQLLYPDSPFYSMGYFFGCFIVHIFIVTKEHEQKSRNSFLTSLADIYFSMHLFDIEKNTIDRIVEPVLLTTIIDTKEEPQDMLNTVIRATVNDEYLDNTMEFVKLSTLSDRMANKNNISCEVVGRYYGWHRFIFIPVEKKDGKLKKVILATQIIDEEKKEEIKLLFQSNNDELTDLLNRRSYETEIKRLKENGLKNDFVYISMDLNGLKTTNDTLGHTAGDEMICGAAECMKKTFGLYGNVFRIGGDEFCALITSKVENLRNIKSDFDDTVSRWSGEYINNLSISCGYVWKDELQNPDIKEIVTLADKRMYEDKDNYYKNNKIDRRGQKDAYAALFYLYTKILKINITSDTFQVIRQEENEHSNDNNQISRRFYTFATAGNVHPDDVEMFLNKTDINFLREHFKQGNQLLNFSYRRKTDDGYKLAVMDIVPTYDYTHQNQTLFLYVKS